MKKGDFLLVYGTLRRGQRADLRKQAHQLDVTFLHDDAFNGEMFHIGCYPGVKLLKEPHVWNPLLPTVVGELFRIRHPAIVAIMDAYESYDADNPSRGLYDRTQVQTKSGKMAWVYTYNPPVRREQLLESGDWCKSQDMPVATRMLRRQS